MRMAGPDIVLFVVGALLFGGALTAIIVTQGPDAFTGATSATGIYTVTFPTAMKDVGTKALAPDASSGKADFEVTGTNLVSVHVKVTCADTVPGDTFAMTVVITGPGNLKAEKSASCGAGVDVPVIIQSPPSQMSVQGGTDEEAIASIPASENATAGVGTWTVAISGSRNAPGAGLPIPVSQANPTASATLSVETYAPKLDPLVK